MLRSRQDSSQVPMQGRRRAAQSGVRRGPAPVDLFHHRLLAVGWRAGHFAAIGDMPTARSTVHKNATAAPV